MCSTPFVLQTTVPGRRQAWLTRGGLWGPEEGATASAGLGRGYPSFPTCLYSLPGAAAGVCRPVALRLPLQYQTRALKWCPKGNLPMNWNVYQEKKKKE